MHSKSKFMLLPADFDPIDATVDEVASWRRESRWTVFRKIREGIYASYSDGRIRKVVFASVKADRERALNGAPIGKRAMSAAPTKRPVGRPRKDRAEEHATARGAITARKSATADPYVRG